MHSAALRSFYGSIRSFHRSRNVAFPRQVGISAPPLLQKTGMLFDEDGDVDSEVDNSEGTSAGHLYLQQQRQILSVMRLIEHDMPKLVQWRVPFTPPPADRALVVRTIEYGGEEHPATSKRTVVVPVARLPLTSEAAIHNCKLLAGSRWTPTPPRDAGIGPREEGGEHGYIKVSCEDYPQPGMNLKWVSDALDRLVQEANTLGNKFADVPVDDRHVTARKRKAKTGEHRTGVRPSIRHFPREWLPSVPLNSETQSLSSQ